MAETRKIAAILAADVVGFQLVGERGRGPHACAVADTALWNSSIPLSPARISVFKRSGDGVSVEFRSVVEAVRCAITVQSAMIERNIGMPADQRHRLS